MLLYGSDLSPRPRRLAGASRTLIRQLIVVALAFAALAAPLRSAEAVPFAEVGDRQLRSDIEILAARGLISGPISTWPIPVGFLKPLRDARRLEHQPAFIQAAARRVLQRLGGRNQVTGWKPAAELRFASEPELIRDFGTSARNQADVRAGLDYEGDLIGASLRVGDQTRLNGSESKPTLDGSYVSALLGNWQVYLGEVDQWYGPGWESSLILSNNARPIPRIGLLRNSPDAFKTRWLSWLGPWQLNTFIGLLDGGDRIDRNIPIASLRFSFEPVNGLEIGLTRITEFCGQNHTCDPFKAAFGFQNTDANRNVSNEEASIEFKYHYDFKKLSFSPYIQFQNEDTGPFVHSFTSHLAGLTWAGPWGQDGGRWRLVTEYTDSRATLNFLSFGKRAVGTAYNNTQYLDGFRYRGRTLGFSLDSESTLFSVVALLTDRHGLGYRFAYHNAHINTAELARAQATGNPATRNVVSAQPVTINEVEAGVSLPYHDFVFDFTIRGQDARPYPATSGQINFEAGISYRF